MKKMVQKYLFSGLIFITISVLPAFSFDGTVISTRGKVELKDGDSWKPLSAGDTIVKGSVVSTGFKSEASIKIGESTFVVEPLSRITIEQLAEKNDKQVSQMFLDAGSVRADIKSAENKRVGFTMRSPVATASVRGSANRIAADGRMDVTRHKWDYGLTDPNHRSSSVEGDLADTDGLPDLSGLIVGKAMTVKEGNGVSVSQDGQVKPPQQTYAESANSVGGSTGSQSSSESKSIVPATASSSYTTSSGNTVQKGAVSITVSFE